MRSLNNYGLVTNTGEVINIAAHETFIEGAFLIFRNEVETIYGGWTYDVHAIYPASAIYSVTKQNQYTEEEILAQIAGEK